ncbi:MAG: AAA family ATPase [bacterium]|nr:AAA family ATPase [bacterium]
MRIDSIKGLKPSSYINLPSLKKTEDLNTEKPENRPSPPPAPNSSVPVCFSGKGKDLNDVFLMRKMQKNFSPEAESLFDSAKEFAKKTGSSELETWHLYYVSLVFLKSYIEGINRGEINYEQESRYKLPFSVQSQIAENNNFLGNEQEREKVLKVVDEHIASVRKNFIQKPQKPIMIKSKLSSVAPSKDTIGDLSETYDVAANAVQSNNFYDSYLYVAAMYSKDRKLVAEALRFNTDLKAALMVDDKRQKQKDHLYFYDDKADAVWKNISIGNDVIFLHDKDNNESASHLISSFVNLINKPGQSYKNIDPEKTDIIVLNDKATFEYLDKLTGDIKKDPSKKDRKTIIVADLLGLLKNSGGQVLVDDLKVLENKRGKNQSEVRFVFSFDPETYQANTKRGALLSSPLQNYAVQTLPSLSAADAVKYLTDDKGLRYVKSAAKKEFSPDVIKKSIELTSAEDGNYPDKAVNLLSVASKYYLDEPEITPEHLEKYIQETRGLNELQASNGQSNIVFDTGKRLKDIVGSPMTKADAETIVKQIKSGRIGTKGFTAYLENGSSYGGGRKHTAEAIAGEAGIPMITINAQDFALKDIDALSQNADLSEMKIRKIVQSAKAQADANPNKAAMIFVENFDNFAPNPLYMGTSIYEKKAFSQLLSEMENARKNDDVNLIVVGSVNTPALLDPNIMKPYKFLNSIIVFPPQDANERREVIEYYIDKMNLQLKGDTKEEKDKLIKYISETTYGFTVVDIMYLLETVKNVSEERGKDKIDSEDMTEAYLQTVSGRVNKAHIADARKDIVTSHEAAHGVTLEVMYEIAEKQNIPWHLPDRLNFITLDPRGEFGGAMFHKSSDNQEYNFETMMSNLVCSFGGHSAEKIIYNMPGSWGITGDLDQISGTARAAVLNMGMGPKTGVYRVPVNNTGSPDVSEAKLRDIEADIDSFIKAGNKISDMIVENYKDFILQFTERHSHKVGTGECIISSDEFKKELEEWREGLSESKKAELLKMEEEILSVMQKTKKGE